ncbi:hypothetical protein LTR85_007983 [Meristemomyces frigidus]|nr:hypothetical protein LTR85_007983 [Meristemomyces frigidus]
MARPQETWYFKVCGQSAEVAYTVSANTSEQELREYLIRKFKIGSSGYEVLCHGSSEQCDSRQPDRLTQKASSPRTHDFCLHFVRHRADGSLEQRMTGKGLRPLHGLVNAYFERLASFMANQRGPAPLIPEKTPTEPSPDSISSASQPSLLRRASSQREVPQRAQSSDAVPGSTLQKSVAPDTKAQTEGSEDGGIDNTLARMPRALREVTDTVPKHFFEKATIRFVFSRVDGAPLTSPHWDSIDESEPLWFFVDQVKGEVADDVVARLATDQPLLKALNQQKQVLAYILAIDQPVCNEQPFELTLSGHRFARVADLFADSKAMDLLLTVHVRLVSERHSRPAKGHLAADQLVRHHKRTIRDSDEFEPGEFVCFRLGDVVLPTHELANKATSDDGSDQASDHDSNDDSDGGHRDAESHDRNEVTRHTDADTRTESESKNNDTPTSHVETVQRNDALIGYVRTGQEVNITNLKLLQVPTWDFEHFCIGDNDHHCYETGYSNRHHWLPPYQGVKSLKELCRRVNKQISQKAPQPGSGVPFLPTSTLNVYHAALVRPATGLQSFPEDGVSVAVRFVDHLDLGDVQDERISSDGYKNISFPTDLEVQVEPDDIVTTLKKVLWKVLRVTKESEGVEVTSHVLFKKPLSGQWELQLWVMPQSPKLRKLFRYPNGCEGSTDQLHEFLDPEMVARGDRRLYMEAHIIVRKR